MWRRQTGSPKQLNGEKDVSPSIEPNTGWTKKEEASADEEKINRDVMSDNLKSLLRDFFSHQFRASWQSKEMKDLIEHLPPRARSFVSMTTRDRAHRTIVAQVRESVADRQQLSQYHSQIKASMHETVLHRRAI